ncbi:MAG: hypothetical protein K2J31_05195 [Alistipes sp.]|nr:hypothetical protein [Alistipes sp.]
MVKTLFYSLVSICALALCGGVSAQSYRNSSQSVPNGVLLSEWVEGDYLVRRYLVKGTQPKSAEFVVQYAVGNAQVSGQFDENSDELRQIGDFISRMKNDTLRRVTAVNITGYSSPDGSAAYNAKLAKNRANDLLTWLNSKYGLSSLYTVSVDGRVAPWSACADEVRRSSLQNKNTILDIVNSSEAAPTVERQLKAHTTAWNWLRTSVLPVLRRTVVTFTYTEDSVQQTRELIRRPAPAPAPQPDPCPPANQCCCGDDAMDESVGIIVIMEAANID